MLQPNKRSSRTDRQINNKLVFIYQHLIKLGYHKILQLSLCSIEQLKSYLSAYFQCTPSRLQLIEWLIAIVFPEYRQMSWFVTQKDLVTRLTQCLWKIGVMPVNKHTKNLDYKKYVQATIGYQNAVGLIFSLVELAFETVLGQKSKNDVAFGQLFHQLADNFTELVNQNYDVYGITFPCKFVNVNQVNQISEENEKEQFMDEFEEQYNQFFQEKMIPLLIREDEIFDKIYASKTSKSMQFNYPKINKQQPETQDSSPNELQLFADQLSKYGRQYHQKYTKLVKKIETILSTPQTKSRLIPYYLEKKQHKEPSYHPSVKESIENRSIRISPAFCKKYHEYKKILRQIKTPKDDQQFMTKRNQILQQLHKLNEDICI